MHEDVTGPFSFSSSLSLLRTTLRLHFGEESRTSLLGVLFDDDDVGVLCASFRREELSPRACVEGIETMIAI